MLSLISVYMWMCVCHSCGHIVFLSCSFNKIKFSNRRIGCNEFLLYRIQSFSIVLVFVLFFFWLIHFPLNNTLSRILFTNFHHERSRRLLFQYAGITQLIWLDEGNNWQEKKWIVELMTKINSSTVHDFVTKQAIEWIRLIFWLHSFEGNE